LVVVDTTFVAVFVCTVVGVEVVARETLRPVNAVEVEAMVEVDNVVNVVVEGIVVVSVTAWTLTMAVGRVLV
jgi:hypothetical protein